MAKGLETNEIGRRKKREVFDGKDDEKKEEEKSVDECKLQLDLMTKTKVDEVLASAANRKCLDQCHQ